MHRTSEVEISPQGPFQWSSVDFTFLGSSAIFESPVVDSGRVVELTNSGFSGRLRRYARRSGISKRITAHTFRHAIATEMLKAGADLRHIQELLGHDDLSTTQRYTHIIKEELKKVHDRTHPREQLPLAPVVYRGPMSP